MLDPQGAKPTRDTKQLVKTRSAPSRTALFLRRLSYATATTSALRFRVTPLLRRFSPDSGDPEQWSRECGRLGPQRSRCPRLADFDLRYRTGRRAVRIQLCSRIDNTR